MDKAELMPSDVMLALSVLAEAWEVVGVAMLAQARTTCHVSCRLH